MTDETASTPDAKAPSSSEPPDSDSAWTRAASDKHFRFGWWALCVFAALGLVLESFNGLRVDWYLGVANQTRRHMFTLGHAHGTLLALVNLAFAMTLESRFARHLHNPKLPSAALLGAGVLIPAGFFTGGLVIYDGDPGLGIALVPVGALLLVIGTFLVARAR